MIFDIDLSLDENQYENKIQTIRHFLRKNEILEDNIIIIPDGEVNETIKYRSKMYYEFKTENDIFEFLKNREKDMAKEEIREIVEWIIQYIHEDENNKIQDRFGIWIKMNQMGECMLKFEFYDSHQHMDLNIDLWISNFLETLNLEKRQRIISIYYQWINEQNKNQRKNRNDMIHFCGQRKLRERIFDLIYYISPDRFTQINWYTQNTFYSIFLNYFDSLSIFNSNSNSNIDTVLNPISLFCFGRDIGALTLLLHTKVQKILGFTYCPIVYQDCCQNWDQISANYKNNNQKEHEQEHEHEHEQEQEHEHEHEHEHEQEQKLICKARYQYSPRVKLYQYFPTANLSYNNMIIWSAGRHGLRRDELIWMKRFIEDGNEIMGILYISCNIKTLTRDLEWILENIPNIHINRMYTLNQFPGTEYIETHTWLSF
jgi:tRNA/tmRNA/rRNA uracil-C5-methylase (TrmA/RlmC/RlmD family)